MKKRICALLCAGITALTAIHAGAIDIQNDYMHARLAAGDVCGMIENHDCGFENCNNNGIALLSTNLDTCPDCGEETLKTVCSATRQMNGSLYYFYVNCYVSAHDDGCETKQTRFYTDKICTNCNYLNYSSNSHVQSYIHTLDASCYDDNYCWTMYKYEVVPRS